ncbi:hypothetical protein PoB_003378800 [Plakobranchus ocellatus]|uniref:Uncharacterized protein n=1 Tax=Plakobranchus ocellatus TaxID=259542 RepID=A0AAV4AJ61_9GAST|nr:hypothetical protein PoB_003378800 [Plakobranchus ocellatus]
MLDTKSIVEDVGVWVLDTKSIVDDVGVWVLDTKSIVEDVGVWVFGAGSIVDDVGVWVLGTREYLSLERCFGTIHAKCASPTPSKILDGCRTTKM